MDPFEGGLSMIPGWLRALAVVFLTVAWGVFLVIWYLAMIPTALLGLGIMLFRRLTGRR